MANKILTGLREAAAHAKGERSGATEHVVRVPIEIDVRKIRESLGMSQAEFARRFGFAVGTLQGWEQGRRRPDGASRVLLTVIARQPKAVMKALEAAA